MHLDHQANSGGYTSIKSCQPVALQGVVHTKDSLGSNGEKHDDDDDDSTVVADSLILEEGQAVAMSESGGQVRYFISEPACFVFLSGGQGGGWPFKQSLEAQLLPLVYFFF